MIFAIEVLGVPAPKGSNRAMLRGGRAVFVPGGSRVNAENLKSWDHNVRMEALAELGPLLSGPKFVEVSLAVSIVFRLARPKGHWSPKGGLKPSAPIRPISKPDIDKLTRSTLDSLTGLVFDDDSRVVKLTVRKEYAIPGHEGARIEVEAA